MYEDRFGTEDAPIVVPSLEGERIIGVTDPEDDNLVVSSRRGRGCLGLGRCLCAWVNQCMRRSTLCAYKLLVHTSARTGCSSSYMATT